MRMAFINRISEHPNRIKLIPVSGETNVYDVVRHEGEIEEEGTPLNAENLNVEIEDAIKSSMSGIDIDNSNNVHFKNLQSGKVSVKAKTKKVVKKKVTFPKPFTKIPIVTATLASVVPQKVELSVAEITTTGFSVVIYRTNDVSTDVNWIATI